MLSYFHNTEFSRVHPVTTLNTTWRGKIPIWFYCQLFWPIILCYLKDFRSMQLSCPLRDQNTLYCYSLNKQKLSLFLFWKTLKVHWKIMPNIPLAFQLLLCKDYTVLTQVPSKDIHIVIFVWFLSKITQNKFFILSVTATAKV